MRTQEQKENLIDIVIQQIEQDIKDADLIPVIELLSNLDWNSLYHFLPENKKQIVE